MQAGCINRVLSGIGEIPGGSVRDTRAACSDRFGVFAEDMADYIYLLENRLSSAQKNALAAVREVAREKGLTVFLVGGAVRDLTSGSPVRDLDVAVQGNALKLKKDIEKLGATVTGEFVPGQALFLRFPGNVRLELGSTLSVTYPKPGKPVVQPATILDDLRRRDFTANAMALSLNEGSYGLLMDPLNGVADIENRELRLVSNYGFIEDPIRMVRAVRLMARLGWQMDEKTQARYETGKEEGYIAAASDFQRGYEAEEIVHEEDPLRVLRRLEAEGWMKLLAPAWTSAKVNVAELEKMREGQTHLQLQGIHPDASAGNFPLLTAKLSAKEVAALTKSFPRHGFVAEIESLDAEAKEFAALFASKAATLPSQVWKLLHATRPEVILAAYHASKNATVQARFKSFFTESSKARQRVPYSLMQEMRITPELPNYHEIVDSVVFELMDGKLETVEEQKVFLEPHSPPAPPPTIHLRRPRAAKKEGRSAKGRVRKTALADSDSDSDAGDSDAFDTESDLGSDADGEAQGADLPIGALDDLELEVDLDDSSEDDTEESHSGKASAPPSTAKKSTPAKPESGAKGKSAPPAQSIAKPIAPAKSLPTPASANKAAPAKPAAKSTARPSTKQAAAVAKPPAHAPAKPALKTSKPGAKATTQAHAKAPVKKAAAVPAPKKPVKKTAPPAKKKAPVKKVLAAKVPVKKPVHAHGHAAVKPTAKKPAPQNTVQKAAPKKTAVKSKPSSKPPQKPLKSAVKKRH
jgi:tRNA nucleotidyltransferase (CCA-adding enzyme)